MNHLGPTETAEEALVTIVDDDEQIASALGSWFDLRGLYTTQHASGESLLLALRNIDGTLLHDIDPSGLALSRPLAGAVLDLNLGGMNGIELAKRLRALHETLPIVIISALPREDLARYGDLPLGVKYLKKPFDLNRLEDALFQKLATH